MVTRFTDDLSHNTEGSDFIVRRRFPVTAQILLIFAIAFIAIYVTAAIMRDTGNKSAFFLTLMMCIGSLTWFTVYFSGRLSDLVLATEFQNAMLASAAQLSTRFCLITKGDGAIVYVDPSFQKLFPHFMRTTDRTLDGLLSGAGVPQELVRHIHAILQEKRNDRTLLSLRKDTEEVLPIVMTIDVLPKPKGYFLLRGRDYIEKRSEGAAPQGMAETALAQALNALPEGILVADGSGTVVYANQTLEHWLGYAPNQLLRQPLKVAQVIYQYEGMDAGRLASGDFTGEAVLQRRDRNLVTLRIRQASLGRSGGFSAILAPAERMRDR